MVASRSMMNFSFVWGEQGIGDEIMFAMFLEVMVHRAKNMVIALDHRLIPLLKQVSTMAFC
jgi:hypothetical protein